MPRLTDAAIRALPLPTKGNRITYDDVPGFGVRVTAGGARSFVLNYVTKAGRERRITIGSTDDWNATDARHEARRLRQIVDAGGDPLGDIEATREAPTVADLIKRYEIEYLPRLKSSSAGNYRFVITKWITPHFGAHAKVADITFEHIDALHRKITKAGHLYQANRVVALMSKMFALAVRWAMRDTNPCKGVEKNREHSRRRYLTGEELARLTAALAELEDRQAADIIRVLLLTGCRRGEGLAMKWGDVDLGTGMWSKPADSVKQNVQHDAPLSAPVRQLLAALRTQQTSKGRALGEFVFPGIGGTGHRASINKPWKRLLKAAGIAGLRIHDLRHSFASQVVSFGGSLPLVGALLGHSTPATTARYSHMFTDPMRAAAEKVAVIVENAGKVAPDPVQLHPKRGRP